MAEVLRFILLSLATWRVSSLFVNEGGPGDMFARFRYWVGVRYDAQSNPYGTTFLSTLFTCIWCLSLWIGLLFSFTPFVMGRKFRGLFYMVVQALSLSSLAIWFHKQIDT